LAQGFFFFSIFSSDFESLLSMSLSEEDSGSFGFLPKVRVAKTFLLGLSSGADELFVMWTDPPSATLIVKKLKVRLYK
jgi:hypothetical protein